MMRIFVGLLSVHGIGSDYVNVGFKQVCHSRDGVFTMFFREWPNEIKGHCVKMVVRNWYGV